MSNPLDVASWIVPRAAVGRNLLLCRWKFWWKTWCCLTMVVVGAAAVDSIASMRFLARRRSFGLRVPLRRPSQKKSCRDWGCKSLSRVFRGSFLEFLFSESPIPGNG